MNTKQVIVMRKDLKMRRGKEIAQGSHASMAFLSRRVEATGALKDNSLLPVPAVALSAVQREWLLGSFAKVCLQVNSEAELDAIEAKAKEVGVECHVVIDSGRTEFNGIPTKTCLALGPDEAEKIDKITGNLTLY